ncbi:MAG: ABC transporter permease [Gracilibacteraceae bacterium]|nr:ABC transporter permease [Gracilibacteraceae bacterium]
MKILLVFLADAWQLRRRLPLLLGGMLLCAAGFLLSLPPELMRNGEFPKISIALVNQDGGEMAELLSGMVSGLEMVKESRIVSEDEAAALLKAGETDVVVVLPPGMIDALIYRGRAEITVRTLDPFIGSVSLNMAGEYVKTMNRVQRAALAFHDAAAPRFSDPRDFYRAERAFDLALLQETLLRARHIETVPAVSPYHLQALSLLLFAAAALAALSSVTQTAHQFAAGYFRRLAVHGIRPWQIYAAKTLLAAALSLVLCLAAMPLLSFWKIPCSFGGLLLSAAFLTVILHGVCLVFTAFRADAMPLRAVSARTAFGSFALLLFILFAGGGFYPVYLMEASFRAFNPAWLAHLLAEWVLGGPALVPLRLLPFAAPPLLGVSAALFARRQA